MKINSSISEATTMVREEDDIDVYTLSVCELEDFPNFIVGNHQHSWCYKQLLCLTRRHVISVVVVYGGGGGGGGGAAAAVFNSLVVHYNYFFFWVGNRCSPRERHAPVSWKILESIDDKCF